MHSERRDTFLFKFKDPKIEILKVLSSKLTLIKCIDFRGDYGKILDLLIENMDLGDVITLAQFHNPPLRVFTFFRLPVDSHLGRI